MAVCVVGDVRQPTPRRWVVVDRGLESWSVNVLTVSDFGGEGIRLEAET